MFSREFLILSVLIVGVGIGGGMYLGVLEQPDIPSNSTDPAVQQGMNRTVVEQYFIEYLNEERQERGVQLVSQRQVLTEMGESHSQVMAREGEIGHVEQDGDTIKSRYEDRGLLPECRLPIDGSNRYYEGAENAAATWIHRSIESEDGTTTRINSEQELAEQLVAQWMNSPPHRKAMLVGSADEAGLGLYITDENKVYASLELC
ncbi:CAP domain-containing protein [Halovenus amylolytica]|uniref:CAP domain-containing protein n=1 Tax=Halovenus amylolytica TaxID=2500550 RepID=UPI003D6C4084